MNRLILLAGLLYSAPGYSLMVHGRETYRTSGGLCTVDFFYDWDTLDGRQGDPHHRARHVCLTKYGPRSPCLVKFEQVGPNDYQATCGAKQ